MDTYLFAFSVYFFLNINSQNPGVFSNAKYTTVCLLFVIIYLILGWFHHFGKKPIISKLKLIIILSYIGLSVYLPTFQYIGMRFSSGTPWVYVVDNAPHLEISGKFLAAGKNPYAENRNNTELATYPYQDIQGNRINPALFFNDYPPLMVIIAYLGNLIFDKLIGFFDARIISLIFFSILLWVVYDKFRLSKHLLSLLILIGLNPIFNKWMIMGTNDVWVTCLVVLFFLLLDSHRYFQAALVLGLSLAMKQTAWFVVPFFVFYLYRKFPWQKSILLITITLIIGLGIYFPFYLWNPMAFINSQLHYLSGTIQHSFPIAGFGFGRLLLELKSLSSIYDYYPFWAWQLAVGSVFVFFYAKQYLAIPKKRLKTSSLLLGYAILLSIIWFFNRFLYHSYLANNLIYYALGIFWEEERT